MKLPEKFHLDQTPAQRLKIEDGPNGVTLSQSPERPLFVLLFAVIGLFILPTFLPDLRELYFQHNFLSRPVSQQGAVGLTWAEWWGNVFQFAGGALATIGLFLVVLWMFTGRRQIEISVNRLTARSKFLGLQRSRTFTFAEVLSIGAKTVTHEPEGQPYEETTLHLQHRGGHQDLLGSLDPATIEHWLQIVAECYPEWPIQLESLKK